MESKVTLRPANPTLEDGLVYAKYLNQAADGFFGFMLGKRFAETIADSFATTAHDFSFENVIFADEDRQTVGMASGFTAAQHHRCSNEVLTKAKGFPPFRMAMIQLFFGSIWRFLDTLEDGDFYLQAIAVEEGRRGLGIGSMMIDAMETRAIESEASHFALDVAQNNEGAWRLYEGRGMSVIARWPRRFPVAPFRVLRMTKVLDRAVECANAETFATQSELVKTTFPQS